MNKILANACLINPYGEPEFIPCGYLVIGGDRIVEVGSGDPPDGTQGEWLDLQGQMVLPGMINAHAHLYSSLALGMPPPENRPSNFIEILEQVWWVLDRALDRESVRVSFEVGLLEHLRSGVTTIIDHHSSPAFIRGSLDLLVEYGRQWGMNVSGAFEISDRNGKEVFQKSLEENLRFHREYESVSSVRPLIGLHASFTLSDDSLRQISMALEKESNWGIHIHGAEDRADVGDAIQRGNPSVLHRLDSFGLLNENSIVAHGVHFSGKDETIAREREVILIHNPASNANNQVGLASTELLESVNAGLGTDGMQANLLQEAQQGSLIRNSHGSGQGSLDYLELLFKNNPELATRLFGTPLGKLEPAYRADLAIYDYQPRTPVTAENWKGHLLYGLSRPCDVITAGEYRLKDYELVGGTLEPIYDRSREQANRLWERMIKLRKEGR